MKVASLLDRLPLRLHRDWYVAALAKYAGHEMAPDMKGARDTSVGY
jgi:hypothetical protein